MVEEKTTEIDGLILFKPEAYGDKRGVFMETYNKKEFDRRIDAKINFVQDNLSVSKKGVLRGLHLQKPPFDQGKFIQVLKGSVLDVVIDLRKTSSTYGQHYKIEINDKNRYQLWIPRGFAHGFLAKEENTIFSYKCDNPYSKDHEMSLLWNDKDLGIDWGIKNPLVSQKDMLAESFKNFNSPFK
jgi:dTDP-4-dehydrorhamnose 3,5-epimerase